MHGQANSSLITGTRSHREMQKSENRANGGLLSQLPVSAVYLQQRSNFWIIETAYSCRLDLSPRVATSSLSSICLFKVVYLRVLLGRYTPYAGKDAPRPRECSYHGIRTFPQRSSCTSRLSIVMIQTEKVLTSSIGSLPCQRV